MVGLFSAGVAEWLGSGLQLECVGGDPLMLVRIRPPAPNCLVVECGFGVGVEVMWKW